MKDWFEIINQTCEVPSNILQQLKNNGFVVIPGPVTPDRMKDISAVYDTAFAEADDMRVGSTTNRVDDLVNRDASFDAFYIFPPLLKLCHGLLGHPFKLSNMIARTVRPGVPAQGLHVDFEQKGEGWPMAGFIFMVDEFREDNGATRFLPGSHSSSSASVDVKTENPALVSACGPAGSLIVYNGSILHGHGPNTASTPRRSIQGAFIRRDEISGADLPERMRAQTLDRITPLAKYLLAV